MSSFWDEQRKKIGEVSLNSFRLDSTIRQIPLFEVKEYKEYTDHARNFKGKDYDWYYAMTQGKKGYGNSRNGFGSNSTLFFEDSVLVDGYRFSKHALKSFHHYNTYEVNTHKKINDFDRIIELGGGAGDFARFVLEMGYTGDYIIYDLPEISRVQRFNLEGFNVRCTSNYSLPRNRVENTLFVSTWALSECPLDVRQQFLQNNPAPNHLIIYQKKIFGVDNEEYFKSWEGKRIDIPWIPWDGGSKYLIK